MNNSPTYITLYPNVIPVRGYSRSVLMDLYMGKFLFIPNYFCDFLIENKTKNLQREDLTRLGNSESDFIEVSGLLDHLIREDYMAEVDSSLLEGLQVESPDKKEDSLINDCIIEISKLSDWSITHFLEEIDRLGVKFLEVRFLDFVSFEKNHEIIQSALHDHSIEFLHFIVPFESTLKTILQELTGFHRLNRMTIYNTSYQFEGNEFPFQMSFSTQLNIDHSHCGCIDPSYFTYTTQSYYSNRKNNSCLSHKLSIDQFGEIKNCPSKKTSFGKTGEINLEQTIQLDEFKKEWHITKESILICSDCEFRWMCSDCRVFIQDESNILSKPSKCGYNPYINKWINEPGYVTELECGVSIIDNQLSIDREKLNQINISLWP